ncbi:MAG: histidine kinase [Gemmatimonadaceae bacterium]
MGSAIAAGCAVGIIFGITVHFAMSEGESESVGRVIVLQMLFFGGWGALVVPLTFVTRIAEDISNIVVRGGWFVLIGLVSWLTHSSLLYWASGITATTARTTGLWRFIGTTFYYESVVYVAILSVIIGLKNRSRARLHELHAASLALQLSRAQWQALQAKLQPHFLFNALHTVSMLARAGQNDRIVDVTAKLAGVLRAMLEANGESVTTLRDELALANQYLAIELVRFDDRLDVDMQPDTDALNALIPRLILQPLIENSIRHGIAQLEGRGCITVRARRRDSQLIVTIGDNGRGVTSAAATVAENPSALGLRLVRERLFGFYGQSAALEMVQPLRGGTLVTISIPWREASEENAVP